MPNSSDRLSSETTAPPEWIEKAIAENPGRDIFPVEREGRRYWIKFGRPTGSSGIHALGYRLSALPFLRPVQVKDALQATAFEAGKLQRLHGKGVPVPQVLWQSEKYFVMGDTGESLAKLLKSTGAKETERRLLQVVEVLSALHLTGEYHGASQIRNFTLDEKERVSVIDFEESFEESADLKALQFRDLFLLLYSLHRQKTEADYPALLRNYMESSGNREFEGELHRLYERFRWLAKLVAVEGVRKRMGSDADILHRLFQSLKS